MRLHPFSMNVEAPRWSAWTTGLSAVNCGATDGADACCRVFHRSTSRFTSSRIAVISAICCSRALYSPTISVLSAARSSAGTAPALLAASSRDSTAWKRERKGVTSVVSAIAWHSGGLLERQALGRRQELLHVEEHHQ